MREFEPMDSDADKIIDLYDASPGAALMFTSGVSHGEAIGSYRGEPLYHASLAPEEYRALLKSTGFRVVAHIVEDPNCDRRTIWLAQAEN
jgi:hypothetical protein